MITTELRPTSVIAKYIHMLTRQHREDMKFVIPLCRDAILGERHAT